MTLFDPERLLVIAGPCALENEAVVDTVAEGLARLRDAEPALQLVFKGSFDKANRTSLDSPRGPGLDAGLALLQRVKDHHGFPVLTDFHTAEQAEPVGKVADILQVPAFLCRQTDLLLAAARTGRVVNVKKGQFLSPPEARHIVDKLEGADAAEIWLTERGTTFGYQNLVVDMRSFPMLGAFGHPVIMDATHAVQMPGGSAGTTGGKREFVPTLARAALAAGAHGLFIETHPEPDQALSDGPNQIALDQLPTLLRDCLKVWQAVRS
ncbi:MAG: 3-deoxy-8-phosphooctulonate synthase [Opitutales bacterium]